MCVPSRNNTSTAFEGVRIRSSHCAGGGSSVFPYICEAALKQSSISNGTRKKQQLHSTSSLATSPNTMLLFLAILAVSCAYTHETEASLQFAPGRHPSRRSGLLRTLAADRDVVDLNEYQKNAPFSVVDAAPQGVSPPAAFSVGGVSAAGSETQRESRPPSSLVSIGNHSESLSRFAVDELSSLTHAFPPEATRSSALETAAFVPRRRNRSGRYGLGPRLRRIGSRISHFFYSRARQAKRMFNLLRLQFRDRHGLSRIPSDITKEELWLVANGLTPTSEREETLVKTFGSKPGYPVPVTACEAHREASLSFVPLSRQPSVASTTASEAGLEDVDAIRVPDVTPTASGGLMESDETPLLQTSQDTAESLLAAVHAEYHSRVVQFSQKKSAEREQRSRDLPSGTGPLRVAIFQWNTELFKPTPFEFLLPFCREHPFEKGKPVIDLDNIDMFFVTIQENNRYSPPEEAILRDSVLDGLNAISITPTWTLSGVRQLNNTRGTMLRSLRFFTPNTQAIMWFARDTVEMTGAPEFCMGSIESSEKGFVGVKMTVAGVGKVLIAGIHVTHKRSNTPPVSQVLSMMAENCGGEGTGSLDDFDIVLVAGDFNARLNMKTSEEVLTGVSGLIPFTNYLDSEGGSISGKNFMRSLQESYETKESLFQRRVVPVLFMMDSMIPNPGREELGQDFTVALREAGFSSVNVCYRGGFSYPWSKDCRPYRDGEVITATITSMMKRCFSPSGLERPQGTGFLDRVIIRAKGDAGAFLMSTYVYHNTRSDHIPFSFVVHLFGSRINSVVQES
ncbi:hypothetical protein TGRUB_202200 [Toxoplasma gondii RUB]|uniref:Inositol polyphosphate-related phosphatase domain-containing protein n=3 Tax=Toxoplasma gondii TaxID=5811 RepID=A0A086LZF0_TOXGO|nr:hypothetical protein TGRUB_202200 [Toxoplasma gondii RUB]KFH07009.1 hypothetical protein TGVAND_202200 [Toxoplasma gondii VAND]KFH11717.1 hypothetical protein TGMAS_202200 [Toxoplasma gondii MAS]